MALETVCQHCRKVELEPSRTGDIVMKAEIGRRDQYPDLPALTNSAHEGCELCGLFKNGIQASFQREEPKLLSGLLEWDGIFTITILHFVLENAAINDHVDEGKNGPFQVILDLESPHIVCRRVPFDVFADEGSAAAIHGKMQRRLPNIDPSSDMSVGLIKGWLRDCDESHSSCLRQEQPKLPTRVIDVSYEMPRLVVTGNTSNEYVAFSHCWGDPKTCKPPLRTETTSLEARIRGICINELPRNFQDAIVITRKLGIRYIWIDSLCIIQDSSSDWKAEAARMGDVYKHSYLTLVATCAVSSHDGFLRRPKRTQQLVKVPYHDKTSKSPRGHFYLSLTDMHWAENSYDKYIEGSVWNQRGWTFQERLLPKRVLHFAKDMFCLECRTREYTEDNRPPVASENKIPWLENDGPRLQGRLSTALSREDRLYQNWYFLVEHYSIRDFTYAKDKLPAIAGLAREMAGWLEDEYLAGLWKNDLSRGLLWQPIDYGNIKLHIDRAPSWSWAYFDGQISWAQSPTPDRQSQRHTSEFRLLGHETGAETPDGSAYIHDKIQLKLSGRLLGVSVELRQPPEGLINTHDIILHNIKIGEGSLDLKNSIYPKHGVRAFLVHRNASSLMDPSLFFPAGLLLEMVSTARNEHRRVGIFKFTKYYSEGVIQEPRLDVFDHCPTEIFTLV